MAKKGGRSKKVEEKGPRGVNADESKLRIDSWEDVADDVDQFHIERDRLMLDGDDDDEEDEEHILSDEEEVLGVDYADSDDSDDDEDDDNDDHQDDSKTAQDDSDDEEIIKGRKRGEEEEEIEGWGTDKKNYYGGNDIQTEEDAIEEEREALRIQSEKLKGMREEDFFDADEWAGVKTTLDQTAEKKGKKGKKGDKKVVKEDLPTELPEDPEARLKVLKARHPEFEPLAKEFLELQELHTTLGRSAAAAEAIQEGQSIELVKFRALSAYLGVLGVYFAVVTSDEAQRTGGRAVREHGVMEGLVKARTIWESVKDLVGEEIGESPEGSTVDQEETQVDAHSEEEADSAGSESEEEEPQPVKSKKSKKALASLLPARIRPSKSATTTEKSKPTATSDFGDSLPSVTTDLVSSRRRALNFHASQLHSKSSKRARAVVGGDSDIPHKERTKEKEARLQAEALKKRELLSRDADLGDSDPEDAVDANGKRKHTDTDDEEYYDFIANASKRKKEEGKASYDRARDLERGAIVQDVDGTEGDKRAINYMIQKNKGLTPHRKKEVRNPRVKKRMKFEQAKKKLGSTRAVYKQPTSAYGGELTGIKSGLVKSRKLA